MQPTATVLPLILALLARLRSLGIVTLRIWNVRPGHLDYDTNGTGNAEALSISDEERQALQTFLPLGKMSLFTYYGNWLVQVVGRAWDDGDRASHDSSSPGALVTLERFAAGFEVRAYPNLAAFNANGFVLEARGLRTVDEARAEARQCLERGFRLAKVVGPDTDRLIGHAPDAESANSTELEERSPRAIVRLVYHSSDAWLVINGEVAAFFYGDQLPYRSDEREIRRHYGALLAHTGQAVDVGAVDLTETINALGEAVQPDFTEHGITERDVLDFLLAHAPATVYDGVPLDMNTITIPVVGKNGTLVLPA